jgi:cytochrome c2
MRTRKLMFALLLCAATMLYACGSPTSPVSKALIPATISKNGDAQRGAVLFAEKGCTVCHNITTEQLVGPGMAGVMTESGPQRSIQTSYQSNLPNGSARTEENVAQWITVGGMGEIGSMSAQDVNEAELADLLAYLRTLE